jgi:hypothetical protein
MKTPFRALKLCTLLVASLAAYSAQAGYLSLGLGVADLTTAGRSAALGSEIEVALNI